MSSLLVRLSPPPRHVPLSLRVTSVLNGAVQVGSLVFGFGMIFFWVFTMQADYSFGALGPRTEGVVREVKETGASVNEQPVRAFHYEFSVAGRPLSGVSYGTGSSAEPGQRVDVEYAEAEPEKSRIVGMRRAPFGPAVAFVAVFPLIGLGVVFFGMRWGFQRNALLRDGMLRSGEGELARHTKRVEALASKFGVEQSEIDQLTSDVKARHQAKAKLELYDPQHPQRSSVILQAEIDDGGELRGRAFAALAAPVIPALIFAASSLPILTRLGIDWKAAVVDALSRWMG